MDSCPTCGREDFESKRGIKLHHARAHGEKLDVDKITLTCDYCGGDYEVYPYRKDIAKYCDDYCKNKAKDHPQSGDRVTCTCDWCGSNFTRLKSASEHRERSFCCRDCYGEWRSDNIVEENHPRWRGGGGFDYGVGWNAEKRRNVRARDNHRCCACGISQEKHKEKFGAVLSVHHIRPARLFDDPQERNAMDNLITLCRPCHRRWEGIPLKPDTRNND